MSIIETRIANARRFLPLVNLIRELVEHLGNDSSVKYKQYLPQKPKSTGKFSFNAVKYVQSFRIEKPIVKEYIDIKADIDRDAEREGQAIKQAFKPHTIDFGKRKHSGMAMGCISEVPREVHFREVWKKVTL